MKRVVGIFVFLFSSVIFLSLSERAEAYPEFIAYGYKSCTTCHYLGTGGGGLTDYGRAVFASEIAAKPPGFGDVDDEKLAEYSHFLGKTQSPYWFKPGIKYRRLMNISNPSIAGYPGSSAEKAGETTAVTRWITMQADLNIASFTNEDATFGFIGTLAYAENQQAASPNVPIGGSEMMAREYFLRWIASENAIFYLGLFDKSFGIKHPDHTAVNRQPIRVGMNDQVHGLMFQWQKDAHEVFVHPFWGNIALPGDQQRRGGSLLYEYQADEKIAVGGSLRSEYDETVEMSTVAGHGRIGLQGNHAFLNELGYKQSQTIGASEAVTGFYDFMELQLKLVRGTYLQSIFQLDRPNLKEEAYNYRWGIGFLYFPIQRIELRSQAIQTRTYSTQAAGEDQWVIQAQLHLSL